MAQRAKREKLKLVMGLIAPSGAGKTLGALMTAYGMMSKAYPELDEFDVWGKIGVVDTEHERSKVYVDREFGDFKVGEFWWEGVKAPFTVDAYNRAIQSLKKEGVEVVIIDSLSHAWAGEGGILEQHGQMSGNSFQNWGKLAPETSTLVRHLTANNVHIISTLRTKQEYVVETNEQGKAVPRKVGLKPVQKDDMEYEFMINLSIDMSHVAEATKDNSGLFEGQRFKITPEVGEKLYEWLELGVDVKGREEAERQGYLAALRSLFEIYGDPVGKKLDEFSFKLRNTPVEEFNHAQMKRALEVVNIMIEQEKLEPVKVEG